MLIHVPSHFSVNFHVFSGVFVRAINFVNGERPVKKKRILCMKKININNYYYTVRDLFLEGLDFFLHLSQIWINLHIQNRNNSNNNSSSGCETRVYTTKKTTNRCNNFSWKEWCGRNARIRRVEQQASYDWIITFLHSYAGFPRLTLSQLPQPCNGENWRHRWFAHNFRIS